MNKLLDLVALIGAVALGTVEFIGELSLFALSGLSHVFRPPYYPRLIGKAFMEIGYFSLPVVALTAVFTGMVL
ncbi:MAG: ABC transporter permease, partial [Acidocella sp.]